MTMRRKKILPELMATLETELFPKEPEIPWQPKYPASAIGEGEKLPGEVLPPPTKPTPPPGRMLKENEAPKRKPKPKPKAKAKAKKEKPSQRRKRSRGDSS